jgi:hypothetical protein
MGPEPFVRRLEELTVGTKAQGVVFYSPIMPGDIAIKLTQSQA